ncbi:MAG: amidase [Anaerolinea sp.]|nr:amidase [Anaerolinea sp.]
MMSVPSTAWETAAAIRNKQLKAVEAVEASLQRIERANPALNAFVYVDPDAALAGARRVDEQRERGQAPGLLAGVPIGVKDLEGVAGMPHTDGSRAFRDRIATTDSVQVQRLKSQGAVVVGKTNTPEFGYKGFTTNLLFGATGNPWDPAKTPGGSSGGSASAVAAGMVPLATSSDGGGSIRIPAAMCGIYGIKPSAGRVPRADLHASHWGTHSTRGPVSRNVRDAGLYLDAVVGPHPDDLDSLDGPVGVYEAATLAPPPKLRRIAWSADLGFAIVDPEVEAVCLAAAKALASALGVELVEACPGFDDPVGTWYTLAATGDAHMLDSMTQEQRELVEPGFIAFADRARTISGVEIAKAQQERHTLNRTMTAFFGDYDLLLTPTTAALPFAKEGPPPDTIAGKPVTPAGFVPFTSPFNTTGHPAASVPAGMSASGLPIGLQIVAPRHQDTLLLSVSAAYEQARPWGFPG